jgi:hypothetical protein
MLSKIELGFGSGPFISRRVEPIRVIKHSESACSVSVRLVAIEISVQGFFYRTVHDWNNREELFIKGGGETEYPYDW